MAYIPKEWKDLPDETTPIQASDLNHIEQGIGDLNTSVSNLNTSIGDLNTLNTTNKSSIVGAINEVYQNNVYSTDETVVGKWIDGKPIYRKVTVFSSILNNRDNDLGIQNIDTIIESKVHLLSSKSEDDSFRKLPTLYVQNNSYGEAKWAGGYFIRKTGKISFQVGNTLVNIQKCIVIIEYTKTTD